MSGAVLFVGERPSLKAARYGHTWEGANAAARTLHNALDAAGVDREARAFVNLWTRPGVGKPAQAPSRNAVRQVREAASAGARVVALGQLVVAELEARRTCATYSLRQQSTSPMSRPKIASAWVEGVTFMCTGCRDSLSEPRSGSQLWTLEDAAFHAGQDVECFACGAVSRIPEKVRPKMPRD